MRSPSASQLVTIAAACTTSSSPAAPTSTANNLPSLEPSSTFHLPGGSPCSSSTTGITHSRLSHGESVHENSLPNDWGNSLAISSVIALRGGGSNYDKNKQNDRESDRSREKDADPSKKSKNKKKKSSQNFKQEKASSQSKKQSASDDDASTSKQNSQSCANRKVVEEIVEQTDYYEILGIPKNRKASVTKTEIQKAYRKRALQVHPDKTGGDRRAFDKVAESFDVLSDDGKREIYDRFGKEGLEHGGASAGGMQFQDIFQSMFQQAGQRQSYGRTRQNYTMRYQIEVTLEDLYNGTTQDVVVTAPITDRRKQKNVQVHIPKGSMSGQSIVLSGEMDFANDTPGDLVFVISQRPHPVFTRKGHDLAMELTISLEEAICGLHREIRHLDGSSLWIASVEQDENGAPHIIQTGEVQLLKGRGMPKKNKADDEYGDLYIQFRVEMPKPQGKTTGENLSKEEMVELSRLLSKLENRSSKKLPEPIDEVEALQIASVQDFGRASGPVHLEDDEYAHHHEDASPFSSHFFQGAGGGSSFYFGSSFAGRPNDDDNNVQCHQM